MIEDGINDPIAHLKRAKMLKHPFERMEGLKQIHRQCINKEDSFADVKAERNKILDSLRKAPRQKPILDQSWSWQLQT